MIITKEDDYFLIKIHKEYMNDVDIFDKKSIMDLFQVILTKLKNKYEIKGLLETNVYVNSNYGLIIEIQPIYSYFDEIDMRIKIHIGSVFMNEIELNNLLDYSDIYYYKNKFYGIYNGMVDSQIIYKECEEIIEKGIKVC